MSRRVDFVDLCPLTCACHAPEWCADNPAIGCDRCRDAHGHLTCPTLTAPPAPIAGVARPTRDAVVEAMQYAWDDFVGDTGCFPDCFEWHGGNGTLWAFFDRGNFATMVAARLAAGSAA